MSTSAPPVFHPDHPHNRQHVATPLSQSYDLNISRPLQRSRLPTVPPPSAYKSPGGGSGSGGMSDSDVSATSSPCRKRCFCGKDVVDGGIYCSIDCARSDAFSSLCYKPGGPSSSSTPYPQPTLGSSAPLSRHPSSAATALPSPAETDNMSEWTASHYRRLARADSRRDERREERRRRRAEGSVASSATSRSTTFSTVSSASSSRVPDLVGGYTGLHSRNASTASTASTSTSTSGWSGSALSRNPSSASNVSTTSRRYRGDKVGVIQEDEDEEEEFLDTRPYPRPGAGASLNMAMSIGQAHKRGRSGHARKKTAEVPMGMGKDMRDILEEIISMEKSFNIEDEPITDDSPPPAGLFTAVFDKPPRTPSPVGHGRKKSIAPHAPVRGHRSSLSLSNHPSGLAPPPPPQHLASSQYSRPSSMMGLHQSSLSESHTALYLATASPVAPSRRSASPKLRSRNSLTFTPEAAGPSIFASALTGKFDSPAGMVSTPSRRRPQISPSAAYGTMDGWRFPGGTTTPKGPQQSQAPTAPVRSQERTRIPPHLLWPSHPQFPQSPGVDTPTFLSALHARPVGRGPFIPAIPGGPSDFQPPQSGMRLGVLLGSGEDEDDVEMDMDDDEESTEQGHGVASGGFAAGGAYLPVFLEAEGFRQQQRTWGM